MSTLRYVGGRKEHHPLLPERDLQADELTAFGGLALLLGTGLYEVVDDPDPADVSQAVAETVTNKPRTSGKRRRR